MSYDTRIIIKGVGIIAFTDSVTATAKVKTSADEIKELVDNANEYIQDVEQETDKLSESIIKRLHKKINTFISDYSYTVGDIFTLQLKIYIEKLKSNMKLIELTYLIFYNKLNK